jgi:hypothetical protein
VADSPFSLTATCELLSPYRIKDKNYLNAVIGFALSLGKPFKARFHGRS